MTHPERGDFDELSFGDPSDQIRRGRIEAFLSARISGCTDLAVESIDVASHGVSASCWIVQARWRDRAGASKSRKFVFRLQTTGRAFDSSRAAEFGILAALTRHTTIRAPRALWFGDDESILGTPFAVYEWLRGKAQYDLFSDKTRPATERRELLGQFLDAMVHLHSVDWARLGLARFDTLGRGSSKADREDPATSQLLHYVGRLRAIESVYTPSRTTTDAIAWLLQRVPAPRRFSLIHGDLGPHNALIDDDRLVALVDWEFATVSDPVQDLAWFTIRGRSTRDNFAQDVLTVDEAIDAYSRRTGIGVDLFAIRWWQGFGIIRAVSARAHQALWRQRAAGTGPKQPIRPLDEDDEILRRLMA